MANEKHIFIGIGGSGCQTVSQIKEKVYEKINMLITKQEDLNEIIDKAYEMIIDNKNNNEDSNGNK